MTTHRLHFRLVVFTAALVALLACVVPRPAHAGLYRVPGTCDQWTPWGYDNVYVTAYGACPDLIARNVVANRVTPAGVGVGWRFDPPPGTAVWSVELQGSLQGLNGWQAAAYTEGLSARELVNCPGASCPGGGATFGGSYPTFSSGPVVLRVRCGRVGGCPNDALSGQIYLHNAVVTLTDTTFPAVALAGGPLLSGGWKTGTQTLLVDGSDNTGIREVRVLIDGRAVKSERRGCNDSLKMPCTNGRTELAVPLAGLADGAHAVTAEVVDGSGNPAGTGAVTIHTDSTPPTQPLDVTVEGGAGWRARNAFAISWRNPAQTYAPIAGANWRACPSLPAAADKQTIAAAQARCKTGSRAGANLTRIRDLALPGPGLWDLSVWLTDAAGNQQPASAVEIKGLGYDSTPPGTLVFTAPSPDDPARVHVAVSDDVSGIAGGVIEVRHDGEQAWQPLPTESTAIGLTAPVDDETLAKGLYYMRARAVDRAGLETSNDRLGDGNPATIKLPVRLASTLQAGRPGRRICTGRGKHRSCHRRLATKPTVRVGRATTLSGRLTVAGKVMPGAPVEVWRRLELDGAEWTRLTTVTTSRTGRFSYRARRGPARAIRFRYPGTPLIRGRNRDVQLRVRAAATLNPSRHTVINGEIFTFRGRLKGGWIPAAGALVELQVRTRGSWRTFAQPRANPKTGRFAYRYRFETVRGTARFQFRARVRRQPGLPFITGASNTTRVTVRGLTQ